MLPNFTGSFTTIASWIPKRRSVQSALAVLLLPFALAGCGSSDDKNIPINPNLRLEIQQTQDKEGKVVLSLQAFDTNNYPLTTLDGKNVTVEVDGKTLGSRERLEINPLEDRNPPPAYIAVLLDFSGSMNCPVQETDTKAIAALQTLQALVDDLKTRKSNTYINIIPFAESRGKANCKDYPVTADQLQPEKFILAGEEVLNTILATLKTEAEAVCGATNLYDPIQKAIDALGNEREKVFHPEEPELTPRLGVIVLSDGYDNADNEETRLLRLQEALQKAFQSQSITVHTLGYGLTPEELGKKYNLDNVGRPATRFDAEQNQDLAEEFVDQESLVKIAQAGGGYNEFAKDPKEIAEKLQSFFDAILGGYEIRYDQPNADRGSRHSVRVIIQDEMRSSVVSYRMPLGSLTPLFLHLGILAGTVSSLVLGAWFFHQWSQSLKKLEGEN